MPRRRVALKPGIHSLGEMMEGAVLAFFQVVASSQIFPLCRIVPVSALSRSPWHRFAAAKVITFSIICNPRIACGNDNIYCGGQSDARQILFQEMRATQGRWRVGREVMNAVWMIYGAH